MAAQAVTLTGTGEILFKYTDSGTTKSIRVSSPASIFLNDSFTVYKYKKLSGTPVVPATAGLITFTEITSSYKELIWDFTYQYYNDSIPYYTVKSLVIGSTTYDFGNSIKLVPTSYSVTKVSDEIFKLNNPNITPTSYLKTDTVKTISSTNDVDIFFTTTKSNLVINIEDLTDDIYLKIVNDANGVEYLVKGVTEASAIPTGFTATTDPCGVSIPL